MLNGWVSVYLIIDEQVYQCDVRKYINTWRKLVELYSTNVQYEPKMLPGYMEQSSLLSTEIV